MASEENARSRASERERIRFPRFTDIFGYMMPPSDYVFPFIVHLIFLISTRLEAR
jgi:hypothetical protein